MRSMYDGRYRITSMTHLGGEVQVASICLAYLVDFSALYLTHAWSAADPRHRVDYDSACRVHMH
jgi:hypothetical protein